MEHVGCILLPPIFGSSPYHLYTLRLVLQTFDRRLSSVLHNVVEQLSETTVNRKSIHSSIYEGKRCSLVVTVAYKPGDDIKEKQNVIWKTIRTDTIPSSTLEKILHCRMKLLCKRNAVFNHHLFPNIDQYYATS